MGLSAKSLGLFLILVLSWGFSFITIKLGTIYVPGLMFALPRGLIGVLALLPVALRRPFPRTWAFHRDALIIGFFNFTLLTGLLYSGIRFVSAGESSVLMYSQPLWTALLAAIWLGEKLTPLKIVGLGFGFVGVVAVLSDKIRPGGDLPWPAYLVILAVSVSWAMGNIQLKRRAGSHDLIWLTTIQMLYGTLPLIPVALIVDAGKPIDLNFTVVWTTLFTAVIANSLAWVLWFRFLQRGQASASPSPAPC